MKGWSIFVITKIKKIMTKLNIGDDFDIGANHTFWFWLTWWCSSLQTSSMTWSTGGGCSSTSRISWLRNFSPMVKNSLSFSDSSTSPFSGLAFALKEKNKKVFISHAYHSLSVPLRRWLRHLHNIRTSKNPNLPFKVQCWHNSINSVTSVSCKFYIN